MSDTAEMGRRREGPPGRRPLVDDELADQLLGRAPAGGAELLSLDGLLSQVTEAVLERALAEEMTGHLGYEKHDPAGRGSGNSRNGMTPKTVFTDVGGGGSGGAAGPQRDLWAARDTHCPTGHPPRSTTHTPPTTTPSNPTCGTTSCAAADHPGHEISASGPDRIRATAHRPDFHR
jgi:hypothetical protein